MNVFQFFIIWQTTKTTPLIKARQEKIREFQTQLLHYFSKSDNKSNHHHVKVMTPDSQTTNSILAWCLCPSLDWYHAGLKYRTTYVGTELCNVETNHVHFVGRVQWSVVALLWNPPETRGTLRMDRLSYHLNTTTVSTVSDTAKCPSRAKMRMRLKKMLWIPALDHITSLWAGVHPLCCSLLRVCRATNGGISFAGKSGMLEPKPIFFAPKSQTSRCSIV